MFESWPDCLWHSSLFQSIPESLISQEIDGRKDNIAEKNYSENSKSVDKLILAMNFLKNYAYENIDAEFCQTLPKWNGNDDSIIPEILRNALTMTMSIRAQLFTFLKADLHQDINGDFAFSRCLNGTFPWRKLTQKRRFVLVTLLMWVNVPIYYSLNAAIPSRKCSIIAPAKW